MRNQRLKLFVQTSGVAGLGAKHVYLWLLVTQADEPHSTGPSGQRHMNDGPPNSGYYAALMDAVRHAPEGSEIELLLTEGHELHFPFDCTREERIERDYRKPNKKANGRYVYETEIRAIDAVTVERSLRLSVRKPNRGPECELMEDLHAQTLEKWRDVKEMLERADGKFL